MVDTSEIPSVVQPTEPQIDSQNNCDVNNGGCDHICDMVPIDQTFSVQCGCNDGYFLDSSNGKMCIGKFKSYFLSLITINVSNELLRIWRVFATLKQMYGLKRSVKTMERAHKSIAKSRIEVASKQFFSSKLIIIWGILKWFSYTKWIYNKIIAWLCWFWNSEGRKRGENGDSYTTITARARTLRIKQK